MIPAVAARDLARELGEIKKRGALAFDADGTLWSGDVGEDFFFGVIDSGEITSIAVDALFVEARSAGVDTRTPNAARVARELYTAYLAGRYDEQLVCELMTWINAGWTRDATRAFVDRIVDGAFASRIHPEVKIVIDAARSFGHEIFVVSASPRPIVEAGAALAGIAADHVIAATSVIEDDRFAARVHRPIPYAAGKASALRASLGDLPLLAAFGDNAFDAEMLMMADRPIAVRPKNRLIERAPEIRGLRRLTPLE